MTERQKGALRDLLASHSDIILHQGNAVGADAARHCRSARSDKPFTSPETHSAARGGNPRHRAFFIARSVRKRTVFKARQFEPNGFASVAVARPEAKQDLWMRLIKVRSPCDLADYSVPPGTEVIVDCDMVPCCGYLVCAEVHGQRIIRRLIVLEQAEDGTLTRVALVPHNPAYPTWEASGDQIVGVVVGLSRPPCPTAAVSDFSPHFLN